MIDSLRGIIELAVSVLFSLAIILLVWKRKAVGRLIMLRFFEGIGNGFFRKGTREAIFETDRRIYGQTQNELIDEVSGYYGLMAEKVDLYLDKFYSFKGQWEQIGTWLKNNFTDNDDKDEIKKQMLHEMLDSTICPDYDLNQKLKEICDKANDEFNDRFMLILKNNKVGRNNRHYDYQLKSAVDVYKKLCIPDNAFNPVKTAGAGIAAGIVASTIADGVFSGLLDNFLPGAVAESLAGPLGIGFGVIIGLATNYAGLKIDELINRAEYKESLLKYIDSERELYTEIINGYFQIHAEYSKKCSIGQDDASLPLSPADAA